MTKTPGNVAPALRRLASRMGVATTYTDGLRRRVGVRAETVMAVCNAMGADLARPGDAADELRRIEAEASPHPPAVVAWDGELRLAARLRRSVAAGGGEVTLEDGTTVRVGPQPPAASDRLPLGYHRLRWERGADTASMWVIAAPGTTWRREGGTARWGVALQLAAVRSDRGRSLGDLADLEALCRWVAAEGGDLVALLPLLPTFNDRPAEPSPYSPVSRLFWSEVMLDLGERHRPASEPPGSLRVDHAMAEVRDALSGRKVPPDATIDRELARYAAFRGAQARLGRSWRSWPAAARSGDLSPADIDPDEERFHLLAQLSARAQLHDRRRSLDDLELQLGLDLAVGVHPDGYDPWSRPGLFAAGMTVGAPPDSGFPNGQSWGFPPVLPAASRREGHAYLAASFAHQAALADVLRIDHVMAMHRLYWIPDGMGLDEGTYVRYATDENFAVACLESTRHRCEIVGENLGTVPRPIDAALRRHRINGMYLAQFAAAARRRTRAPAPDEVAMVGTHDTPPFAGWLRGVDIGERVRLALMPAAGERAERRQRSAAARRLATAVGGSVGDPDELLDLLLDWLGRSASPLVTVWLEDLWLEPEPVNVPGSGSDERPNWQRPMSHTIEELTRDPAVRRRLERLRTARRGARRGESDIMARS